MPSNTHLTYAHSTADDIYGRAIIDPPVFALGNTTAGQTQEAWVWNANPEALMLGPVGFEGRLVGLSSSQVDFTALQPYAETKFTAKITGEEMGSLHGNLTVDLFGVPTVRIPVTGGRWAAFVPMPQIEVVERLEWKTDVIQTKVSEERIALRRWPRRTLVYKYVFSEAQAIEARRFVASHLNEVLAVPEWTQLVEIDQVQAGQKVIEQAEHDARPTTLVTGDTMILWQSPKSYLVTTVEGISRKGRRIDLETGPGSAMVRAAAAPIRFGRAAGGLQLTQDKHHPDTWHGFLELELAYNVPTSPPEFFRFSHEDWVKYDGVPVWIKPYVNLSSSRQRIRPYLEFFDNESGPIQPIKMREQAHHTQTIGISCLNRAEANEIRQLLMDICGQAGAFYLPSWTDDYDIRAMPVTGPIAYLPVGLLRFEPVPKDGFVVWIKASSDQDICAKVTRVTTDAATGQTRLEFETPVSLPAGISNTSQLLGVRRLSLMRLASDTVSLTFGYNGQMETTLTLVETDG